MSRSLRQRDLLILESRTRTTALLGTALTNLPTLPGLFLSASAMGRPRLPPLPAFMVTLIFGQMGEEALLTSNRVRSRRMQELGVQLRDPKLLPALRRMLNDG